MKNVLKYEFDVDVPMSDGTILRTNIVRPDDDKKHPVLLTRTPYGKDATISANADDACIDIPAVARDGYAVVVMDTRATGCSEGDWEAMKCFAAETQDGLDTLKWILDQPFCDGNIGTFGGSYVSMTQWAPLVTGTEDIKAAVPSVSFNDPNDGFFFRGGELELGLFESWMMRMQMNYLLKHETDQNIIGTYFNDLYNFLDALKGLPVGKLSAMINAEFSDEMLGVLENGYESHENYESITFKGKHDKVTAPTLNITGWYDVFLNGTLQHYDEMIRNAANERARANSKLIIGPWSHYGRYERIGDGYFGVNGGSMGADLMNIVKDFFDYNMRGIENRMKDFPNVRIFTMGENIWHDEETFPYERTQYTPYYLHENSRLNTDKPGSEKADEYDYDPKDPVPSIGGACLVAPHLPEGVQDYRYQEERGDVLTYSTGILEEDIEVTGPVKVYLWAASSARDTDFVCRLIDVKPDGYCMNLCDGIIRARYRDYQKDGSISLIEPEIPYLYEIDLWSVSNLFKKGHRIRLEVTSSNFPRWDRNANSGNKPFTDKEENFVVARQMILHDEEHASYVLLPVIPR